MLLKVEDDDDLHENRQPISLSLSFSHYFRLNLCVWGWEGSKEDIGFVYGVIGYQEKFSCPYLID